MYTGNGYCMCHCTPVTWESFSLSLSFFLFRSQWFLLFFLIISGLFGIPYEQQIRAKVTTWWRQHFFCAGLSLHLHQKIVQCRKHYQMPFIVHQHNSKLFKQCQIISIANKTDSLVINKPTSLNNTGFLASLSGVNQIPPTMKSLSKKSICVNSFSYIEKNGYLVWCPI